LQYTYINSSINVVAIKAHAYTNEVYMDGNAGTNMNFNAY